MGEDVDRDWGDATGGTRWTDIGTTLLMGKSGKNRSLSLPSMDDKETL